MEAKDSDRCRPAYDIIPENDEPNATEDVVDNTYCAEYALPPDPNFTDYVLYPYR